MRTPRANIILAALLACHASSASAVDVPVATTAELAAAVAGAQPGHRIVLAPGTYQPTTTALSAAAGGTAANPIEVTATEPGSAIIRFGVGVGGIVEGFKITGAHWRLSNLVIEGACAIDSNCEHAVHLVGNADHAVFRRNVMRDFNAQIKSNGFNGVYPDDVLVESNHFYDTRPRATANPVTKIDVVGGSRWIVRANTIHDFSKAGGDTISYAAFLKGGSTDGLFERNLVACFRNTAGGVRLGLSLGGGGTSPDSICQGGSCNPEHRDGVIRNNIVMNCNDVGIYVNEGANTRIFHNTLYATTGIDLRYATTTATVSNNLVSGAIRNRDGATSTQLANIVQVSAATYDQWFVAPAAADFRFQSAGAYLDAGVATAPPTPDDFCGNARDDGTPDLGAIEHDGDVACETTVGGGVDTDALYSNGFEN